MNSNSSPASSRWAVILLSAAVLALAGCGRKGGLDLPPNSTTPSAAATQADVDASKPSVFDPSYGADTPPAAAKGKKRPFALDPLLNSN